MAGSPKKWMTRDFVFAAPPLFPDVVALEPERFVLRPGPGRAEPPSLFVLALGMDAPWNLDASFAPLAQDLVGPHGPDEWLSVAVQLLGWEGRYGAGAISSVAGAPEAAGVTLVRGRGDRAWLFGWRCVAHERDAVERAYGVLMQGLQARASPVGEKTLRMQYAQQARSRQAAPVAGGAGSGGHAVPGPADVEWDRRLAKALGESDPSAVARLFADTVVLVEEPYGEEAPLGASRLGGGPDLPADAWPSDVRGMRHPFLLQINLAEIDAVCGPMPPLPEEGLLSFFVHGDALQVEVVYTPPGVPLLRHSMTDAIIAASAAAVEIAGKLDPHTPPGALPHGEGDLVTAELLLDGKLRFAHTPDPVWAVGDPGSAFEALSDERWASAAHARLRPGRSRTFDAQAAEQSIEETGVGSLDDLYETHEAFLSAAGGMHAGPAAPRIHQMLGHAFIQGNVDCRNEAASLAGSGGHAGLAEPQDWAVLAWLRAGSATGREFWDASDLVIMIPAPDLAERRWDRCVLLSG